ncbi:MAG: hypothetical protein JXA93_03785 [Anaerolineae bacterium]|nr:hypothetical protein [Anaerolineae bacterium]
MLIDALLDNVWLDLAIWIVLYVSDYQLTIISARRYAETIKEFSLQEGSFELTPFYEGDVDALRRFSPRMVLMLTLQCAAILIFWTLTQWSGDREVFAGFLGAFFLLEVVVHMRHARNLVTFHYGQQGGLRGRLERARWLVLRLSAVDMALYAVLFVLLFLLTGSWFVLGGVGGCLITAVRQWHSASVALARKAEAREATQELDKGGVSDAT